MVAEQRLIAQLKEDLGHSPVVSNLIFGFVLAVVEKIFEVEFACPCNPRWNAIFSAAFFVVPAFIACMMMLLIHDWSSQNEGTKRVYSILPPLVWHVLLFLDGQYFVCAMTYWSGTFISVDQTFLKWCTPANTTTSSEKLMAYSERMFILSQAIGFGLLLLLSLVLIGYVITKCLKPNTTNASESENMELNPQHRRNPQSRDDTDD